METIVDLTLNGQVLWSQPIRSLVGAPELPSTEGQLAWFRKMALKDGVSEDDVERGEFKLRKG